MPATETRSTFETCSISLSPSIAMLAADLNACPAECSSTGRTRVWLCVAVLLLGAGCRGNNPLKRFVRVTETPDSQLADIQAPAQRLVTGNVRDRDSVPEDRRVVRDQDPQIEGDVNSKVVSDSGHSVDAVARSNGGQVSGDYDSTGGVSFELADRDTGNVQPASAQISGTGDRHAAAMKSSIAQKAADARHRLQAKNAALAKAGTPNADAISPADIQEIMASFEGYPPAVRREAARQLAAAVSKSAARSGQPAGVTEALTRQLQNLPELPDELIDQGKTARRIGAALPATPDPLEIRLAGSPAPESSSDLPAVSESSRRRSRPSNSSTATKTGASGIDRPSASDSIADAIAAAAPVSSMAHGDAKLKAYGRASASMPDPFVAPEDMIAGIQVAMPTAAVTPMATDVTAEYADAASIRSAQVESRLALPGPLSVGTTGEQPGETNRAAGNLAPPETTAGHASSAVAMRTPPRSVLERGFQADSPTGSIPDNMIPDTAIPDALVATPESMSHGSIVKPASAKMPTPGDLAHSVAKASAVRSEDLIASFDDALLFETLIEKLSVAPENESEADRTARLIKLRHLKVLSGQSQAATEDIEHLSADEQAYLQHYLKGLSTIVDPNGHPVHRRRLSEAVREFRKATRLASAASDSLEVNSLAFCTEILSFGQITPFRGNRFKAGQQVILYCEVDNFHSKKSADGYQTNLQGTYEVFDENNKKVAEQLMPADQQTSAAPLRDYFIAYKMNLPTTLTPGTYRLQLTMEDVEAKKYGQASIPLQIAR
ncbi:MAG: hypothetical protein AAF958_04155 [Planctomycetota bacterium]